MRVTAVACACAARIENAEAVVAGDADFGHSVAVKVTDIGGTTGSAAARQVRIEKELAVERIQANAAIGINRNDFGDAIGVLEIK